jgi:hypothetical protein
MGIENLLLGSLIVQQPKPLVALLAAYPLADTVDLAPLLALLGLVHGYHIRILVTPPFGIGVRNCACREGNSEQASKQRNMQFHSETPLIARCLKAANKSIS